MRKLMLGLAAAAFAVTLNAQQLEVNTPQANLTRAGTNPTPGVVDGTVFKFFKGGTTWDFRVSGGANLGYILLVGQLATTSTQVLAPFNPDFLDLEYSSVQVIGDGIGFTGSTPPEWFTTNAAGQSNWVLPTNNFMYNDTDYDLQAIVADPAAPLNLNFTAAARFRFSSLFGFGGDEAMAVFTASHAYPIYGANRTQFAISTNGWFRFAGVTSSADFTFTTAEMLAGNPGGAAAGPVIAPYWQDNNMVLAENRPVTIGEDTGTNTLTITWTNARLFSPSTTILGTYSAVIQDLGGYCQIDFHYDGGFNPTPAVSTGIIGVSDGSNVTTNNLQADLVTGGLVNGFTGTAVNETYFQNFGVTGTGLPPVETVDLSGLVMHFLDQDLLGGGNWLVF